MLLGTNPLIEVNPGLMIWTIVCFLVVLFVLSKYAFGPVQKMIDTRRERIQQAIAEADRLAGLGGFFGCGRQKGDQSYVHDSWLL